MIGHRKQEEVQDRKPLTGKEKYVVNFTQGVVQLNKPVTYNKNETTIF